LQETDARVAQFPGKALDRKPGLQQETGIQDGIQTG